MKGIIAATFRPMKINISLFLTVFILCCLLFMEELTEEELACVQLFADLRKLNKRLRKLRFNVHERKVLNAEVIEGKIENLIKTIDRAVIGLQDKLPHDWGKIRKDIRISSQVDEVERDLSPFSHESTYDSVLLLKNLEQVENIWKNKIKTKVDEAIASAQTSPNLW